MAVTIRKNDVKASNLIFLSYGLILLTLFLQLPPSYEQLLATKSSAAILLAVLGAATYLIGIALGVRRGYRWVKIFFVLATLWDLTQYLGDLPPTDGLTIRSVLFLAATIAKTWAAVIITRDLLRRPVAGVAQDGLDRVN